VTLCRLSVALLTSARTWRGSGVSLANIAQGLRDRGHDVRMLAGDDGVLDGFARLGLPVSRVPVGNTGVREAGALARLLRSDRADAILVDRPRDLRLAALASLVHPLAIVNCYNLSRPSPPRDPLSRLAYRRVSLTVFVSETSAARTLELARYIRRRPHRVIHGAVDLQRFRPDAAAAAAFRAAHGLSDAPFVLAVGSLTLDKRYDFLMEIWTQLGPEAPTLVICGDGVHGGRLRSRARDLRLDLRFTGHLGSDLLAGAYAAATCFVHAGAVETFGLSVLEAMASGAAVLAVRGGAVPEVVGDAGLLAPIDDADAFLSLLRTLLSDPDRRAALGQAARRRALEHFSLQRMRGSYVAAVESVCAPCASRS
jgi:glycosyltransferase involved in cell wall biosynthesis